LTLIPEGRGRANSLCCEFDGLAVELRPQDLTHAGVFVITTAPPALDDELELLLRSPIGAITVRGQVVQVITRERARAERRRPGFGLLFVDLVDDQRAWIGLSLDAIQRAERTAAPVDAERERRDDAKRQLLSRRQSTLDQLERDLAALQNKAPWEVLGLTASADAAQARQAYLTLSKRYHPHVYAHLDSPEISRAATELFIAHKRAYTTLRSQRPAPTATIESEPPIEIKLPPAPRTAGTSMQPPGEPGDATAGARASVIRAPAGATASKAPTRRSSRPSKRAPAGTSSGPPRAEARPAHKRRVADADKALHTGLKHLAASRFDEAVEELERAFELCPERRDAAVWLHVCRARKHKAGGREAQAQQEYRALLELDPEHREALDHVGGRGLRKRAGLIGKWFGTENE
jgi:tetratricopeptide (TPR) repeat protein